MVHIWREQIRQRQPVTLTDSRMTRFIITLKQAVNVIGDAIAYGRAGDILVPKLKAALMTDLLDAVRAQEQADWCVPVRETGLRPGGEKLHESLLSREEIPRTYEDANYWVVPPSHASWAKPLPKLGLAFFDSSEYSSDTVPLHSVPELAALLQDVPDRAPND
ncbi:MAG: hypothetical protein EBS89_06465 [Proteobacteria bacterium]|nr:hypothetical protein [Pseudomonadota bacterium]